MSGRDDSFHASHESRHNFSFPLKSTPGMAVVSETTARARTKIEKVANAVNESTRRALREELGAAPPFFLDDLDDAELEQLARALLEARTRQAEAVEEAVGKSLWFLPWGLRGAVRKALLG